MNKKLYVGNLPFSADEAKLHSVFSGEGRQVNRITILMDRETGRSRGFAFVEMASFEDAEKAIAAIHGKEFFGRSLSVTEARETAPRRTPFPGGNGGSPSGKGTPRR